MPLAGVGDNDLRRVADAGGDQLVAGRGQHRREVPEVRGGGHDLGGDDQVLLVADRLGVVALDLAAHPVHEL
jgi:hypothetical protein